MRLADTTLLSIYRHRIARTVAGIVGVECALLMALAVPLSKPGSVIILIAAWPVMGIVYGLAFLLTKLPYEIRSAPLPVAIERLGARERSSIGWPLAAIGLMLPLTLHLVIAVMAGGFALKDFGSWIGMSVVMVGPAHIVLALLSFAFAREATGPLANRRFGAWAGGGVYGFTVAASLVPGGVLVMIPPLLVSVTGLFIPFVFNLINRRLWHERDVLEGTRASRRTLSDDDRYTAVAVNSHEPRGARIDAIDRIAHIDAKTMRILLGGRDSALIKVTLDRCRDLGIRPPVLLVAPLLIREPSIAIRAAEALADRPEAEAALIDQLCVCPEPVRQAIICALEQIGSTASMASLDVVAKGIWGDRRMTQRAARRAFRRVRERTRASGAQRGALAIADVDARGGLSPVSYGALSIPHATTTSESTDSNALDRT